MKKISFRNDVLPLKNELFRLALRKKAENQNQSLEEGHDAPDFSYTSNPEEQAMQRDRIQLIRRLIDYLPEKQRSCMQLRDFEGKSYKEIAQVLGISEEQVKTEDYGL